MSFVEYYHFFYQKKKRSRMNDVFLIDCLKKNVIYVIQLVVFFLTNSRKKTTFYFSKIRSSFHRNRRKVSTIETSSISFRCLDHCISFFEIQVLRRSQRQLFKHQICRLNFCRRCHINHFICD